MTDQDLTPFGKYKGAKMEATKAVKTIHIISLGAGVQSSTMALMAAHGEITPMPECAIFADTQDEPREVYAWLEILRHSLPFPVHVVTAGKLSEAIVNAWGHSQIPAWFQSKSGKPAIGRRQCTKYFKILPVRKQIRRLYPRKSVMLWMGISLDEAHRAKPSNVKWLTHTFPLLDKRLSRNNCDRYLARLGYENVPKSACVECPYRGPAQWRASLGRPEDMKIITAVQSVLLPRGEFLTSQLVPIEKADFSTDEDHGQQVMFGNECEGMCGV